MCKGLQAKSSWIDASKIMYPHYWMNFDAKITLLGHLTLLKTQLFEKFGDEGFKVLALLNEHELDMGVSFFKSIM